MEYSCIGFDLREFPCQGYPSADYSEWGRDEEIFSAIENAFRVSKNEYSLLGVSNQSELAEIAEHVANRFTTCDFVALEMPREIVQSRSLKFGRGNLGGNLDLAGFVSCGLDVCDINGLYTCFNHPEIEKFRREINKEIGLIPEVNIDLALEIAQFANYLDECHRPFVVVRVLSFRGAQSMGASKNPDSPSLGKITSS